MCKDNVYQKRNALISDCVSIAEPTYITDYLRFLVDSKCGGQYKIASVMMRRRKIIVHGHNTMRTHPFQQKYAANVHKIWLHAEIHCILNYYRYVRQYEPINNLDLYVMRLTRDGDYASSFPCDGCLSAIGDVGIRNVIFYDNSQWKRYGIS